MKTLSFGSILCLTTMFVVISGQRQTIRTPNRRRALPDRNSPRPRKYWREVQEIPAVPVQEAETTGEGKEQRRPGPRKSVPKARPTNVEGGLSKVFKIPVALQEPPSEGAEEMTAEQAEAGEKRTKTQKNASTEGMMGGTRQGMQGGDAAQQKEGTVDAAPLDEGVAEGESMEDVKRKGENAET